VQAIRDPARVRAVVVISFSGIFMPPPGSLEGARSISPGRMTHEEYHAALDEYFFGMNFARTPEGLAFSKSHWEAGRARRGPSFHGFALRDVDRMKYWGKWTQPTLALYGTHDRQTSPAHGFDLVRVLPQCELHWLYPAGHFAPQEQPARVAELVAEFATSLDR
jgi:pimeloyl-ACP methyl ester carboxylesterase